MHVTVLKGTDSPERDVSLETAAAVEAALARRGHTVAAIDLASIADVPGLDLDATDLVFPALHGGHGEDGHVQALLDVMGVPYALSGHLASAVAMSKATSKRVMTSAGIATAEWLLVTWNRRTGSPVMLTPGPGATNGTGPTAGNGLGSPPLTLDHILDRATAELGFPLVIKLNDGGSSVGVEIVGSPADFEAAFARVADTASATAWRTEILIERFIPGREFTATILLGRRLPLLEIRPHQGFYDYGNKYTRGASEYLCPAPVDSPYYENMCADALRLWDLLGCQGTARVDFRFDGTRHFCLELNTIPGMTELSLVPKAAAAVGIGFDDLIESLCRDALVRAGREVA
ncbi:ATP-grasp domain-containing protein [bacterium]|nr:ATP-grasp domain-containing protein [bacterium]